MRQSGLSLLEVLVSVLLVSFAAALVVQGTGQGLGLLARVAADQGETYHELMARAWLRESVSAALAPVLGEGGDGEGEDAEPAGRRAGEGFVGTPLAMRLDTLRPLLGPEGVPAAIAWSAAREGGLVYEEGGQQVEVAVLPALERFEYQDEAGAWHAEWPPDDATGLPLRVRALFADGDWIDARVETRRQPQAAADELEFERD